MSCRLWYRGAPHRLVYRFVALPSPFSSTYQSDPLPSRLASTPASSALSGSSTPSPVSSSGWRCWRESVFLAIRRLHLPTSAFSLVVAKCHSAASALSTRCLPVLGRKAEVELGKAVQGDVFSLIVFLPPRFSCSQLTQTIARWAY